MRLLWSTLSTKQKRYQKKSAFFCIFESANFYGHKMNTNLIQKVGSLGIFTTLVMMSIGQGIAMADLPGNHPEYLHTRSDLRRANRLLNSGSRYYTVSRDIQAIDNEIDVAIQEIDRAAVVDRKNINDNPKIDVSLNRSGRLHKVLQLLESARNDLSQTENNRYARGWRSRAEYHVNRAIDLTNRAIQDSSSDRYRRY